MSEPLRKSEAVNSPTDGGSLGVRARRSVLWNTGMNLVTNIGQLGLMLILVRILAPEIYGQFGLLMAVMGFLFVFSAQGTIDYAIQERNDVDIPTPEIFIFALATSLALCLLANVAAIVMRYLPRYSEISNLLHLMSLTFLLHPARALRVAMLQRALDWKRIRILHLLGFLVSAIFSISLAYSGAGIYALVISTFLMPLPYIVDLLLLTRWRPTWKWNAERFRPAFAFGMNRLLSDILGAGRRLVESTAIVQVLGYSAFGTYGRAVSLSDVLCARLAGQTLEALYPAITKIETESERFRRASVLVLRSCVWILWPLAVLMALLADPIVRLLLGEKWLDVIPILPWAFALAGAASVFHTLYKLLLGHKQQRHCLYLDLIAFSGVVLVLVIFLPAGLENYIKGIFLVQLIATFGAAYWLTRHGGIALGALTTVFAGPIAPVAAAWFVFVQVGSGFEDLLPTYFITIVQAACYMCVYIFVIRLLYARQLMEIVPYFPLEKPVRRLLALSR